MESALQLELVVDPLGRRRQKQQLHLLGYRLVGKPMGRLGHAMGRLGRLAVTKSKKGPVGPFIFQSSL